MFKTNPSKISVYVCIALPLSMAPLSSAFALDSGDAPASYGLATHVVVADAPHLGLLPGSDNTAANSALADADGAEEDGVFGHPELVQNGKAYDTNVFVYNPSATAANLVAWVDFDGNGVFDADEASFSTVPAGASNQKIKMVWPDLTGLSTEYAGGTFLRVRISNDPISANDATGALSNGEVEDYAFNILEDVDGDEIADINDEDNDNDGIPDIVEQVGLDTDGDGLEDYLDTDSDNDGIPDYIEAGSDARQPIDTDNDGNPDYIDTDSNNDGVLDGTVDVNDDDGDGIDNVVEGSGDYDQDGVANSNDLDSDNDTIPDAIEVGLDGTMPVDTDTDGIADYLDLDSDNDGIYDIQEGNSGEVDVAALDVDRNGQVDSSQLFGANGLVDAVETSPDSRVPRFAVPDSDADAVRDFRDTDSDNDGVGDILEAGGTDVDGNLLVDDYNDANADGIPDSVDATVTGINDADSDGIDDTADVDVVGGADSDLDGIVDSRDGDANNDGVQDSVANSFLDSGAFPDLDDDNIPDYRDDDSIGNGTGGTTGTTTGDTTGDTTGTTTASSTPLVETGLSGSGCSVSSYAPGKQGSFGVTLLLLSLLSVARLVWRRQSTR